MKPSKAALIFIASLLCIIISCSSTTKPIKEEFDGQWIEFWNNYDYQKDNKLLDLIQTINENNTPLYDCHYMKISNESNSHYLLAMKRFEMNDWEYYLVWSSLHKIEGPFKNDAGIVPPKECKPDQ